MLVEIRDLTVGYGKAIALHRMSMCVNEGEIVTIIGSNGAGKSTLLMAVSGLLKPVSGAISYKGSLINDLTTQERVKLGIALVPEGRRVFRDLSVYENLKLGAYTRKRGEVKADMESIYELFPRLRERWKQQAGSLSGGEQQMLTIGRALMSRPNLLLLDEPSMGLSPVMTLEITKHIEEISGQRGLSIVLVEQNSKMALRVSDRGYLLETGSLVVEGSRRELIGNDYIRESYLGV